jgi:hypothetical protein
MSQYLSKYTRIQRGYSVKFKDKNVGIFSVLSGISGPKRGEITG